MSSRSNSAFSSMTGAASMSLHEAHSLAVAGELEQQDSSTFNGKQRLSKYACSVVTNGRGFHVQGRASQQCVDTGSSEGMAVSLRGDADELTESDSGLLLEMDTSTLACSIPWHRQRYPSVCQQVYVMKLCFLLVPNVFAATNQATLRMITHLLLQIIGVAHHWLWCCCVHVLPAG